MKTSFSSLGQTFFQSNLQAFPCIIFPVSVSGNVGVVLPNSLKNSPYRHTGVENSWRNMENTSPKSLKNSPYRHRRVEEVPRPGAHIPARVRNDIEHNENRDSVAAFRYNMEHIKQITRVLRPSNMI